MNIIVLIKQVPLVDQLRFDTIARRLEREGVESEINPFDKRALTKAIEWKKAFGARVIAVTMGPPQAKQALAEAMAMGADRAVHLIGREFAGADTLATARTLALAVKKIGYDLILTGKYSTDAETAQVPGMLAEMIHIPQITGVTALEISPDHRVVTATRELDQGLETVTCQLPAVISAAERLVKPIKVTPAQLEAAKEQPVEQLTSADLSTDTTIFGIAGSPTFVSEIYSIEPTRRHVIRSLGPDPAAAIHATVSDLLQDGLYGEWKSRPAQIIRPKPRLTSSDQRAIWVVAELDRDIHPATMELLGRSIQIANDSDGLVATVLIGSRVEQHVATLSAYGADKVYVADDASLSVYSTERYTTVLASAIREYDPFAVLIPATSQGRDLAPRVAARLELGLTGDCVGLELDGEGRLVQLKPAYGGNIIAPILTRTRPAMATIRPGMFQAGSKDATRKPQVIRLRVDPSIKDPVTRISFEPSLESGTELETAEVVIGVGVGIGSKEKLSVVRELAQILNAKIGGTRKVVDAGWLPRQVQIGLTGRSISPRLYIAIGTSGKFNHTVGMQRSGVVLAINNQPDAEIFKHADYGLVGDWERAVQLLVRDLSQVKSKMGEKE